MLRTTVSEISVKKILHMNSYFSHEMGTYVSFVIDTYIYMYVYVYICMCVCERECLHSLACFHFQMYHVFTDASALLWGPYKAKTLGYPIL